MNHLLEQLLMSKFWDADADDGGGGGAGEVGGEPSPPSLFKPADRVEPEEMIRRQQERGEEDEEEEEEAPDPLPDPALDPETEAAQERDAEMVELKRQLSQYKQAMKPFQEAMQLMQSGRQADAARVLGFNMQDALLAEYGHELLPEKPQPGPDEILKEHSQKHQTAAQEIASLKEQLAYSELSRDVRDEIDAIAEDVPLMRLMAGRGKNVFYRGMVDKALKEYRSTGEWPSFGDILRSEENAYLDKWAKDASDLLAIPKVREKIGVDFVKRGKGKQNQRPPQQQPPPATEDDGRMPPESAATLLNDLGSEPPVQRKPKGKLSRNERRELAIQNLARARKAKEEAEAAEKQS